MSKRSRKDPSGAAPNSLADLLGPLDGAKIPGGCDRCDAYQTTSAISAGIWQVTVHHDEWCPVLQQHRSRP